MKEKHLNLDLVEANKQDLEKENYKSPNVAQTKSLTLPTPQGDSFSLKNHQEHKISLKMEKKGLRFSLRL